MKTWLPISLMGNCLLVVALLCLARKPEGHYRTGPGAMTNKAPAAKEDGAAPPSARALVDSGRDRTTIAAPVGAEAASPARARPGSAPLPEPVPAWPAAWKEVDPAALSLSEEELGAVNQVRQLFQERMAEVNRDPSDPAYREGWIKAQQMADDLLAAQLGQVRFDELKSQPDPAPPVSGQ